MRIRVGDLRRLIREAKNLPSVWYHGSPWKRKGDYAGPFMFLSDSLAVAEQYKTPLIGSGKQPDGAESEPHVDELRLRFDSERVFDTRRPEHLATFVELVKEARAEDPEEPMLTKGNLVSVHPAPGSSLAGTFPDYGCVRYLMERLVKRGFLACIIAEGTQGASLAVWDPQHNLETVK